MTSTKFFLCAGKPSTDNCIDSSFDKKEILESFAQSCECEENYKIKFYVIQVETTKTILCESEDRRQALFKFD